MIIVIWFIKKLDKHFIPFNYELSNSLDISVKYTPVELVIMAIIPFDYLIWDDAQNASLKIAILSVGILFEIIEFISALFMYW